ncbi:Rid family detoxifying hydrolase [Dasania marina]|uniref:RidA family protein n=1 Tax=Dasania marina TaxID=471499 RepID=UPI0030DB16F1
MNIYRLLGAILCLVMGLSSLLYAADNKPAKDLQLSYVKAQGLPFSELVRVGNILYLSGQIGFDNKLDGLVDGGITAETQQTMENIKKLLSAHGSSMNKLIRCTVMMADMNEFADMNRVYIGYFSDNLPARSAFGVTRLALGARVEIECMGLLE